MYTTKDNPLHNQYNKFLVFSFIFLKILCQLGLLYHCFQKKFRIRIQIGFVLGHLLYSVTFCIPYGSGFLKLKSVKSLTKIYFIRITSKHTSIERYIFQLASFSIKLWFCFSKMLFFKSILRMLKTIKNFRQGSETTWIHIQISCGNRIRIKRT